jgi:hypothetical protein
MNKDFLPDSAAQPAIVRSTTGYTTPGGTADSSRRPSRPGKWPCAKRLPTTASATARAGCGPRCRPRVMRSAAGVSAACSKCTACAPNSPARLCRAPPILTRLFGPPPTAYWASQPPPPSTGSGWATAPICRGRAAAGCIWPSGWTAGRVKSWAGTCAFAMPEALVSEALRRALVVRRPPAGLVVHSDQGSQYTATRFKELVAKHGAKQSMSRRGNCYDNAHAESFWRRFKAELLDGGSFPGLAEARLEISYHIAYYNAERRHSALGHHSPNHFESQLQTTSQLCPA